MTWAWFLVGWIASSLVVGWAIGRWFRWLEEKDKVGEEWLRKKWMDEADTARTDDADE